MKVFQHVKNLLNMKNKTISVTGLRPKKLLWDKNEYLHNECKLIDTIIELIEPYILDGYNRFITGMAEGSDIIFAKSIISLKKKYDHIQLEAVIPFLNHDSRLSEEKKNEYKYIIDNCDVTRILSNTYNRNVYKERNKYLVDQCNLLIGITYNVELYRSGTTQTINMAKKQSIKIIIINPIDFNIVNLT